MHQFQAAQILSENKDLCPGKDDVISADTVSNWECNRAMPDPEQVAAMEELYECPGLWFKWIRLQWPSARERIPENPQTNSTLAAVVNTKHRIADIMPLLERAERDSIDGVIDDRVNARRTATGARETAAAMLDMAEQLEQKGG